MLLDSATLLLIRHGQTMDNTHGGGRRLCGWYDPPLSVTGRGQVARLAEWLSDEPPAALYTSDLVRARQTADALAAVWGLSPCADADLREISCGYLDGWLLSEVQRRHPGLWQRNLAHEETFAWPGGESYRALRARVLRVSARVARRHSGQRVALVSHAGVIGQLVGALRGTAAGRWDLWRPENASLTEVCWAGAGGFVVHFGLKAGEARLSAPNGVGAAEHAQMVACGMRGLGTGA